MKISWRFSSRNRIETNKSKAPNTQFKVNRHSFFVIQTGSNNYKRASFDIFGDETILKFPSKVAEDDNISWATACWKWWETFRTEVYGPALRYGEFGSSTKGLFGELECRPGSDNKGAKKRFEMYAKVVKIFGIGEALNEAGCYNLTVSA